MGNPAGVRRDFEALEKRRMEAVRLWQRNELNQSEVARRVHVCRQTVNRWIDEFRDGGKEALRKAGRAGRKPELTEADRERLQELLLQGPERLGYETPLWTCARVAHLIDEEFGVAYPPGHVWKILDGLGWSCQRPVGRARERNEKAIRHWRRVEWPAIKKKPKKKGARSFSSTKADKPAAPSGADLVAARPNTDSAIQLQLGHAFGRGWHHLLQLLLPSL